MTTEEFIKELNTNEWVVATLATDKKGQKYISICGSFNKEVLRVPTNATAWFDVKINLEAVNEEFRDIGRSFLSSEVSEYLATPPRERKSEKKYWLLLDKGSSAEPWVLGVVNAYPPSDLYDCFWAINHESYLKAKGYQTRFTDADLKKIADGDQDMLDRLTVLKREAPDNVD